MPQFNDQKEPVAVPKYKQNHILFTKDGRRISNAIIRDFDELTSLYLIKTDYGNECFMTEEEIEQIFYLKRDDEDEDFDYGAREAFPHKYAVMSEWRRPLQDYKRRSGRTTRIVDELVQHFFVIGKAECYDHHEPDLINANRMRRYVLHQVMRRLQYEHGVKAQDVVIDHQKHIITNINWTD